MITSTNIRQKQKLIYQSKLELILMINVTLSIKRGLIWIWLNLFRVKIQSSRRIMIKKFSSIFIIWEFSIFVIYSKIMQFDRLDNLIEIVDFFIKIKSNY